MFVDVGEEKEVDEVDECAEGLVCSRRQPPALSMMEALRFRPMTAVLWLLWSGREEGFEVEWEGR